MNFVKKGCLIAVCFYIYSNNLIAKDKVYLVKDSIYKNVLNFVIQGKFLDDSLNFQTCIKRIYVVADELILSELPERIDSIMIIKFNSKGFQEKKCIPAFEKYIVISPAQTYKNSLTIRVQSYKYWEYDNLYKEWYKNREGYFNFKWRKKGLVYKWLTWIDGIEPMVIDDRALDNVDWNK